MATAVRPVGDLVREWRQRRRLSQLDLALRADVSARHLSFVETGRSLPSREMVLNLADHLQVPLRGRNALLLAAGFAPQFPERPLGDPALSGVRQAVERLLAAHEPFPALAVDRHWNMQAANRSVAPMLAGVGADLLRPPVNVLRLSLHPQGMMPRIANLSEWRAHVFARLSRQIEVTGDADLEKLLRELQAYPSGDGPNRDPSPLAESSVIVPLRLVTPAGTIELISTTMVFGTPLDVTLSELAIETFFPVDDQSAAILRSALEASGAGQASTVGG